MFVPVLRKIINRNDAFIERALPEAGDLNVKIGDKIEPFNQLGTCKVSYNQLVLPKGFTPLNSLTPLRILQGTTLGRHRGIYIHAPFNGYLEKDVDNNVWIYKETGREFVLLSGVWGTIKNIVDKRSILVETTSKDFLLPIVCGKTSPGELIVFPNPSDLLIGSFLENFTKDVSGKIFYIGGHIGLQTVMKAKDLNLNTLLAGSISKEAYGFAKSQGLNIGIFEGFGEIPTSKMVFDELKNISNRFVFFDVENRILRVPMPSKLEITSVKKPLKLLKIGDTVQIFEVPYFGLMGTVDTIKESSILVKIPKNTKLIEVSVPNFFVVV